MFLTKTGSIPVGSNFLNYITQNFSEITKNLRKTALNFGPQHPAAHGVLRLLLCVTGELINYCDPHIGLLHRGSEKLIENKLYFHSTPYFDRMDYVSTMTQENAFCSAIDVLVNFVYSTKDSLLRTMFDELTRVLNHLLAVSCHALDVGSMSSIFWAFEEREKIMEFYEMFSGARFHTAAYKPFLELKSLSKNFFLNVLDYCKNFTIVLNEMHNVLSNNHLWKRRLIGIGSYNFFSSLDFNLTGVMARCVGIKKDIRLSILNSYNSYKFLNLTSYSTFSGDSYDRYLIRMFEMLESTSLVTQVIWQLL